MLSERTKLGDVSVLLFVWQSRDSAVLLHSLQARKGSGNDGSTSILRLKPLSNAYFPMTWSRKHPSYCSLSLIIGWESTSDSK